MKDLEKKMRNENTPVQFVQDEMRFAKEWRAGPIGLCYINLTTPPEPALPAAAAHRSTARPLLAAPPAAPAGGGGGQRVAPRLSEGGAIATAHAGLVRKAAAEVSAPNKRARGGRGQ